MRYGIALASCLAITVVTSGPAAGLSPGEFADQIDAAALNMSQVQIARLVTLRWREVMDFGPRPGPVAFTDNWILALAGQVDKPRFGQFKSTRWARAASRGGTCGYHALAWADFMQRYGIETKIVYLKRAGAERGHIIAAAVIDGQPLLADPSQAIWFDRTLNDMHADPDRGHDFYASTQIPYAAMLFDRTHDRIEPSLAVQASLRRIEFLSDVFRFLIPITALIFVVTRIRLGLGMARGKS